MNADQRGFLYRQSRIEWLICWIIVLIAAVALSAGAQTSAPPKAKPLDELGLQVQDQSTSKSQTSAGEGARATQQQTPATKEKTISPEQAEDLFRSVDKILKFASTDTGLPIKHPVERKLIERDAVQAYVEKSMREDKDTHRLERSAVVLKKFGLLPRDFDLSTFLVKMLREQVAAYYDPKTNTVNLLNWVDAEQQKPVLAHELTHALQDQSFGLQKWLKDVPEAIEKKDPGPEDINDDEALGARQAVVEGQAMAVFVDYSLAPTGQTLLDAPQITEAIKQGMLVGADQSPEFNTAPIFLKETLTFPYRYGLDFTVALLSAGGRELAYSEVFKNPPMTTREIMEPKTYLAHEKLPPMKMIDFDKDFKDYERFDIGAMGEFDVDVLVEQYAGNEEAQALYPEWRGGYYFAGRLKTNKSAPLGVVYASRWADPGTAAEFAAVYAKSLAKRYQQAKALGADGKIAVDAPPVDSWRTLRGRHAWQTEEGPVVIEVRGDQLLITESMDEETTKRVGADFWEEKP
jgi:hypothetical protein